MAYRWIPVPSGSWRRWGTRRTRGDMPPCQHRRMRSSTIVVDARRLGEGSAFRGIGTYVRNLLAGLAEIDGLEAHALVTPGTVLPPGVPPILPRRRAAGRSVTRHPDVRPASDLRQSRR